MALGELNLTPEQFGSYTISEIEAMLDGWRRRHEILEDLFIINCALPTYRAAYGEKAPGYRKLTAHRRNTRRIKDMDEQVVARWGKIFNEVQK